MATSTPSSEHLQHELAQLEAENQSLVQQEALLVSQLEIVREKLALSKDEIFKMETMVNQFFLDQESQGQSDFWESLNKNEYVFRGLSKLMDQDPTLKAAFQAVAGSRCTDTQEKIVLLAILTQLSGQPASILADLAKKVLLHNANGHAPPLTQSALGDDANTAVDLTDDDATDTARQWSTLSLADSDIKAEYEDESLPVMFRSSPLPPNSDPGPAMRSSNMLTSTPAGDVLEPRATASTQPKSNLRNLLHQLRDTPTPQPIIKPNASSVLPPTTAAPSEAENGRPAKRLKPLKDVGKQDSTATQVPHFVSSQANIFFHRSYPRRILPSDEEIRGGARAQRTLNHRTVEMLQMQTNQARRTSPELPARVLPPLHAEAPSRGRERRREERVQSKLRPTRLQRDRQWQDRSHRRRGHGTPRLVRQAISRSDHQCSTDPGLESRPPEETRRSLHQGSVGRCPKEAEATRGHR